MQYPQDSGHQGDPIIEESARNRHTAPTDRNRAQHLYDPCQEQALLIGKEKAKP
jgi:hypothetical protein